MAEENEEAQAPERVEPPGPGPQYEQAPPHPALEAAGAAIGLDGVGFCCECMGIDRTPVLDDDGNHIPNIDDPSGTGFTTECKPPPGSIELLNGFFKSLETPLGPIFTLAANVPPSPELLLEVATPVLELPGLLPPTPEFLVDAFALPDIPALTAGLTPPDVEAPPLPDFLLTFLVSLFTVPIQMFIDMTASLAEVPPQPPALEIPDPLPGLPAPAIPLGGCLAKGIHHMSGGAIPLGDPPEEGGEGEEGAGEEEG